MFLRHGAACCGLGCVPPPSPDSCTEALARLEMMRWDVISGGGQCHQDDRPRALPARPTVGIAPPAWEVNCCWGTIRGVTAAGGAAACVNRQRWELPTEHAGHLLLKLQGSHEFVIPSSYFSQDIKSRLFSPKGYSSPRKARSGFAITCRRQKPGCTVHTTQASGSALVAGMDGNKRLHRTCSRKALILSELNKPGFWVRVEVELLPLEAVAP